MFLGAFKSVPARIEFLIWIVREGSRLNSCLVLETTIPQFILMVVNIVLSDSPGSLRVFIGDSEG
jgi:hypothetical protein